jgi:transposase-like protein
MTHRRIRRHPDNLREMAIKQFRCCKNVARLAREIGIPRQTIYRWIDESERIETDENGEIAPTANDREARLRKRISQLKHVLANKTLEVDFFKGALQTVRAPRRQNTAGGELASTTTSEM